jgi:hypothetical protein
MIAYGSSFSSSSRSAPEFWSTPWIVHMPVPFRDQMVKSMVFPLLMNRMRRSEVVNPQAIAGKVVGAADFLCGELLAKQCLVLGGNATLVTEQEAAEGLTLVLIGGLHLFRGQRVHILHLFAPQDRLDVPVLVLALVASGTQNCNLGEIDPPDDHRGRLAMWRRSLQTLQWQCGTGRLDATEQRGISAAPARPASHCHAKHHPEATRGMQRRTGEVEKQPRPPHLLPQDDCTDEVRTSADQDTLG